MRRSWTLREAAWKTQCARISADPIYPSSARSRATPQPTPATLRALLQPDTSLLRFRCSTSIRIHVTLKVLLHLRIKAENEQKQHKKVYFYIHSHTAFTVFSIRRRF